MSYSFGTVSCRDINAGKNGNRVSKTLNGTVTAFCYDNADRLTSIGGASGTAVTHDTLNRTEAIGTRAFGYNAFGYNTFNQHTTTTTSGQVTTLERDAFHRLLRRTVGTKAIRSSIRSAPSSRIRGVVVTQCAARRSVVRPSVVAVTDRGEWDDTIAIVTSDHGDQLGDQGTIQKAGFFEASTP